jgi:hypothetical protein
MSHRALALVLAALVLAAVPATAYTVYLKDGSTIEAAGPYQVAGDRVVITLPGGTETELPLAEVDVDATQKRNRGALGDALVLQDGEMVDLETARAAAPPRPESLGDRIARGEATVSARPRDAGSLPAPPAATAASPQSRAELQDTAAEFLRRVFAGESVPNVAVYLGTAAGQPLLEVTTESEAGVFRGLLVAAYALQQAREERGPGLRAVELRFLTGQGRPAGDFLITPELAAELTSGSVTASEFYVREVRF